MSDSEDETTVEQGEPEHTECRIDRNLVGPVAVEHTGRGAIGRRGALADERYRDAGAIGRGGEDAIGNVVGRREATENGLLASDDPFPALHVVVDDL